MEQFSRGNSREDIHLAQSRKPCRCYAAALRAIWIATKLARSNYGFQIGRESRGGLREDASLRRAGWALEIPDVSFFHIDLGMAAAQQDQLSYG